MLKNLMAAIAIATAVLIAQFKTADAQVYVYPFSGAQPQQTVDFNNPPISFSAQGGVSTSGSVVPIGSVAYASFGNATTNVAGKVMVGSVTVPYDGTVTNINCLNAGTVGTDSAVVALYNTAGTKIANSVLTGAVSAGANAFQTFALTAPIAIQGPGRYFIGYQANGTTDNIRTVAASTFINVLSQGNTGTFGTLPALTPPTTFTANLAPICYLN